MKTSEILDKAADHIKRVGWIQGQHVDFSEPGDVTERPCCTAAAIGIISIGDPLPNDPPPAERALADFLGLDLEADDLAVGTWNDAFEREQDDVIRALRAAAASEREAGR